MALTEQEKQMVKNLRAAGKTNLEIKRAVANNRAGVSFERPERKPGGFFAALKDVPSDVVETGSSIIEGFQNRGENIVETAQDDDLTMGQKARGIGAETFRGIGRFIGDVGLGAAKLFASPRTEEKVASGVTSVAENVAQSETVQSLVQWYDKLPEDRKREVDNALGFTEGLTAIIGGKQGSQLSGGVARQARNIQQEAANIFSTFKATTQNSLNVASTNGIVQKGKELAERFPRFFRKAQESTQEAAKRAARIRESSPAVGEAVRVNLDDRFINTFVQADAPTLKAAREMVDIADNAGDTLRPAQQPSLVAGRVVGDQFDLVQKQKRNIGQQIGNAVDNLPQKDVNMRPSLNQLDAVLRENNITIRKGKLQSPLYTQQQLARLQELYNTATGAGDVINAKTVHGMDRVFSQLQREAKFDKLDNIFLDVNGQNINAFKLFRDVYRNQLDNLDPSIRELNNQYRLLTQFVDDVEDSLLKTPNLDVTRTADPAEFAKVNLRRLAGEAQSTPAYQAVVEQLDRLARDLGYEGARADDLIFFAQELRKLYPETTPPAGLQGSIKSGIVDLAERALRAGAPDASDQRAALKNLLDELIANQ